MSVLSLKHLIQVLKGLFSSPSDDEKTALFNETLLLTLSRATIADTHIARCEVETVQRVYRQETGLDVEEKDIRIVAVSELFEDQGLRAMLTKVKVFLDRDSHIRIASALGDVIRADEKISPFEVDFFNGVTKALGLSAADLAL